MSFYKVAITQEMVSRALKRAQLLQDYPKNFKQHIQEEGDGELTAKVDGILGEMIAEHWLTKHNFTFEDCRDEFSHDYLVEGQIKLEIKTKRRTVAPRINYEATVPQYVHDIQKPTAYLFVSLRLTKGRDDDFSRYTEGYIVGGISRSKFDKIKRSLHKGQHDTSNNWDCSEACYNVYISQLFTSNDYALKFNEHLKG
ncbi:TPA: hypothetical protein NJ333_004429 [Vibrio parahaemolyticus]|nr:hypothetical protein [Vibrio parahaemolyticus]